MSILNTILALSLIIISAVKTADLFIKADHQLEKVEDQFVQQTQNLIKHSQNNQKGNITLFAAMLTLIMSLLLIFFIKKMNIEYREAVYRKESYLCFHYLNTQTEKYIKEMSIFNWSLSAAYLAQFSIVASSEAVEVFKALTIARNLRHFNYIKNLSFNKYCKATESISYLKNTPFETRGGLTLDTNINETTKLRQKKWTYLFYKTPNGIRLKKSFCILSEFQVQGVYIPKTQLISKEIQITALSSSKCFFGGSS